MANPVDPKTGSGGRPRGPGAPPVPDQVSFDQLAGAAGHYIGHGADANGIPYRAELSLARVADGHGLNYRFRAERSDDREVMHDEAGLIGLGLHGKLALHVASRQYRTVFERRLRAVEPGEDGATVFVFAYGDPADRQSLRDETRLSLFPNGRTGVRLSWAIPGGDLRLQSSCVLENVANARDLRPAYIRHWRGLVDADDSHYPGSDELLSYGAPVGRKLGLQRIGVHVELVPPGRRTSFPHAEKTEEELVMVLAGHPDVWLDGALVPLRPGDVVGFPPGTGIAHTFMNNTAEEVRLVVIGEHRRPDNQIWYPLNPERKEPLGERWWDLGDKPLGPHDGRAKKRG